MARTVTTFKWSNLSKGTPTFWLFIFGFIELSCAYFVGLEPVRKYTWLAIFLPWIQLAAGQIKMFITKEVEGAPEVAEVSATEDGKLNVEIKQKDDSN